MKYLILIVCLFIACSCFSQETKQPDVITNADIIELSKSKVPQSVIISKIQTSKCDFDVSNNALIEMSKNGVSEEVVKAVIHADEASMKKSSATSDNETLVKNYLTQKITDESKGVIKVTSFKKTDGYEREYKGVNMYVVEWEAEILVTQEIWFRNPFDGERAAFYVETTAPKSDYWGEFMSGKPGHCNTGVKLLLKGDSRIQKTEKSSRIDDLNIIKASLISTPNTNNMSSNNSSGSEAIPPKPVLDGKPIYKGYTTLDGHVYLLELEHPVSTDEIGQYEMLKNITYNSVVGSKKFSEKNTNSTTENPTIYSLKSEYVTTYTPKTNSNGSTTYYATVVYSLELFDKTNNKLVKKYSSSLTNSAGIISTSYGTKKDALKDVIESQLSTKILTIIFSNFPIKTEIVEIVDSNKKGNIKLVKISAGSKLGVHNKFQFKLDHQPEANPFDLVVKETMDDYSICIVKNNGEFIRSELLAKKKINVRTIY